MDVAWHVIYPRIDREGQLAGKLRRKKLRAEKESLVVVVLGIFLSIDSISSENWYSVALKPINTCRRCKQVSDPYICQERGGKWCGHATLNLLFQESIEDEASRDVSSPRFHGNLLPSFFLLATSRIRKYESSNGVCPKSWWPWFERPSLVRFFANSRILRLRTRKESLHRISPYWREERRRRRIWKIRKSLVTLSGYFTLDTVFPQSLYGDSLSSFSFSAFLFRFHVDYNR